jgi:predicted nucleic acid-binding protein
VLSEFVALSLARRLPLSAALAFERAVRESDSVEVIWVDDDLHRHGIRLLEQRLDKVWTLCDAVSFVVMERLQLREALTTDHHFEQAGFVRLLRTA